jgi:hypothetical protein
MLSETERIFVVEVLKGALVHSELLSPFEVKFVRELAVRYGEYGSRMVVKGKQWTVLGEVNAKLNLRVPEAT